MVKVKKIKNIKLRKRIRRKMRLRNHISGTADCPRISVFRSGKHMSVQAIDDVAGKTIAAFSTYGEKSKSAADVAKAKELGIKMAEKLKEMNIQTGVFDRNGYLYHGKIAAVADGMREKEFKI